jgi:hypothetical protein
MCVTNCCVSVIHCLGASFLVIQILWSLNLPLDTVPKFSWASNSTHGIYAGTMNVSGAEMLSLFVSYSTL